MTAAETSRPVRDPFGPAIVTPVEPTDDLIAHLDLPHRAHPRHGALHATNTRARQTAVATLDAAFPSLGLPRATQATDATTLVVGHADPALVAALDGQAILEELTRHLTLRPGVQLKVVRDKHTRDLSDAIVVQPDAYPGGHLRARAGLLAEALDEGYTVVLDGVEMRTPTSMHLAALFERAFGCPININGYLSTRHHTSFGAHWDDQEVVILQLLGRKDWVIQSPVALSMHKATHGDAVSDHEVWRGRLGPGDAMYVPRGWGHIVNGIDELTFHYTITIPRLNGLHVLDGVLGQLPEPAADPAEGHLLPITAGPEPGDRPVEPPAGPDLLAATPAVIDRLVRRAVARSRFASARRPVGSLRHQVAAQTDPSAADLGLICSCPGGWVVLDPAASDIGPPAAVGPDRHGDRERDGGFDATVVAGMAGQLVRIPVEHLDDVAALTDGRVHRSDRANPTVVRDLLRLGLLDAVADPLAWGLTSA